MCAQWSQDSKIDPSILLNALKDHIEIDGNRVTLRGFEPDDYICALLSAIDFADEIPPFYGETILTEALFAVRSKDHLQPGRLLEAIKEREAAFAASPKQQYVLVSEVGVRYGDWLETRTMDGCEIAFEQSIPTKFKLDEYKRYATWHGIEKWPNDHTAVLVTVEERAPELAAQRGLAAIDLMRGMWNLELNKRSYMRRSSGKRRSVNQIPMGPLKTVHTPDGIPASGAFWYDTDYREPLKAFDGKKDSQHILNRETWILKLLDRSCVRADIESALRLYCEALDMVDFEAAFVRLWSVLERLTFTPRGSGFETTIKRAAFLWEEYDLHRAVLNHLRHSRNRQLHHNVRDQRNEIRVYQAKRYVETLIDVLLHMGAKYDDASDIHAFFDCVPDRRGLETAISRTERELQILKDGMKFRFSRSNVGEDHDETSS